MLPLFDSKPFHNAICCAFQRSGGGCDIVKAHSANRKRWWPLCVLFMEIKYWERNEKKKSAGNGGERTAGVKERDIFWAWRSSHYENAGRKCSYGAAEKTPLCSKMFVLLHYMYFLVCCWVSGVGVVFSFFFKCSFWSSCHSGLVFNSLPLYPTPVNNQRLF